MKKTLLLLVVALTGMTVGAQNVSSLCRIISYPYVEEFNEDPGTCWKGVSGASNWSWSSTYGEYYSLSPYNHDKGSLATPYIASPGQYSIRFRTSASGYLTSNCTSNVYAQFKVYKALSNSTTTTLLKSRCIDYNFDTWNGAWEDSVIISVAPGEKAYIIFTAESEGWMGANELRVYLEKVTFRYLGHSMDEVQEAADSCTITELPYYEGFEHTDTLFPFYECWEEDGRTTGQVSGLSWMRWGGIGHLGDYAMLSFSQYSTYDISVNNWLFTPSVKLPASGTCTLSWYERHYGEGTGTEHYTVMLSRAPFNDYRAFTTTLSTRNVSSDTWTKREVNLSSYKGKYVRFAFHHFNSSNSNQSALLIDDIRITHTGNTGIEDVDEDDYTVNVEGSLLTIYGQKDNMVTISDMMGRIIYSSTHTTSPLRIQMPAAGVYFVRVGDSAARRVMVVK